MLRANNTQTITWAFLSPTLLPICIYKQGEGGGGNKASIEKIHTFLFHKKTHCNVIAQLDSPTQNTQLNSTQI